MRIAYFQYMQKSYGTSYAEILLDLVHPQASNGDLSDIEPLAYLPYDRELAAKSEAWHGFWKKHKLYGRPGDVIASPRPRHYRTTTKRRVFFSHGKFRLRFSHRKDATPTTAMLCSELEPKEHDAIYQFVAGRINTPGFSVTAKHLTYVIIRGSYTEFSVLFNVDAINGAIVRNLKALAEKLRGLGPNIVSSFIFSDPTRSDYYLDNKQTTGAWKIKNLFGPDTLRLSVGNQTYRFDPVSFSQINESMLPVMLENAQRMCSTAPGGRLIDLYCGYGLFANYLGKNFSEVFAIDFDAASVDRGRDTARFSAKKTTYPRGYIFAPRPYAPHPLTPCFPWREPGKKPSCSIRRVRGRKEGSLPSARAGGPAG